MAGVVSEMIGRVATRFTGIFRPARVSYDGTQPAYEFWDRLRRCKAEGYRLAGLFVEPILHHVGSWALGDGVEIRSAHRPTQEATNRFLSEIKQLLIDSYEDSMGLGDSYIAVNPDGTLTWLSPDSVQKLIDPLDYRHVIGYRVVTSNEQVTTIDEYFETERRVTIERGSIKTTFIYENVIGGLLPIVHIPNNAGANEIYGHPLVEPLLPVLAEYDDVLTNSLSGVKVMGNPIPTVTGVDDPVKARNQLATRHETVVNEDGTTQSVPVTDFDPLTMMITSGDFKFVSPAPFTDDAWRMLKNIFLLILEHTNVPEWVWGGAIASSRASVEAQLPAFEKFVQARRGKLEKPLRHLVKVWLAYRSLIEIGIREDADFVFWWPEVSAATDEVTLKKVEFAHDRGLVRDETALGALGIVEDVDSEVEAAREQAATAGQQISRRIADDLAFDDEAA